MARAAVDWDIRRLARKAEIGENILYRFERGHRTTDSTKRKLQATLEKAGIEFLPAEAQSGPGVRMRQTP